jgi:hypothetical protein
VLRHRLVCLGLVVSTAGTARAETKKVDPRTRHGADCQLCYEGASGLELAVPLWIPLVGLEGHSANDDPDAPAQNVAFDPQIEFAIVAEFSLRLGPVGVGFSANGVSLGSQVIEADTGETLGTVDLDAYFGRVTLDWYTPPYRLGLGKRPPLLAIWPYMGARYALFSGSGSSTDQTLMLDGKQSWGEPLFGIQFLLDLRRGWLFGVGGDVGGFSVGSEIAVWVNAEVQYALTNWLNFHFGWVFYSTRYETNGGDVVLTLQGPGAGFGIPLF